MPLRPYNVLNPGGEEGRRRARAEADAAFLSGVKNLGLSGLSSTVGMVGDFESFMEALKTGKRGFAQQGPRGFNPPTTEDVAQRVGADLNTPSGFVGAIGVPDPKDLLKLGVLGAARVGKAMKPTVANVKRLGGDRFGWLTFKNRLGKELGMTGDPAKWDVPKEWQDMWLRANKKDAPFAKNRDDWQLPGPSGPKTKKRAADMRKPPFEKRTKPLK